MGEPGFAGASQVTYAAVSPGVALTLVGGPQAHGTTAFDGADGKPVPVALVAVTVKVYETPGVSPLTSVDVLLVVTVMPPGELVTV